MAFINGIWLFVENEDWTDNVESTSHPVEQGLPITDTVKQTPLECSISGYIVDWQGGKAADTLARITALKNAGTLVTYRGRRLEYDMQITNFSTGHPKEVAGGLTYSMTLKKVRIAKNSYVPEEGSVKNGGTQQVKEENLKVYYEVKPGDCVWGLVVEKEENGRYVDADYKNLRRNAAKSGPQAACDWVMEHNKSAFSRPGDFRTLQIGKRIYLGDRK